MTIQARFRRFHADNPWVLEDLETMAAEWFSYGHDTCSIGMLWEALRWMKGTQVIPDGSGYRLNDNYRSRYTRLLIALHPEWSGRFVQRELRAA